MELTYAEIEEYIKVIRNWAAARKDRTCIITIETEPDETGDKLQTILTVGKGERILDLIRQTGIEVLNPKHEEADGQERD